MTLDLRVLDVAFWKDLAGAERARRGEADDPLSGVVRLESAGAYLEAIATMELPAIDWKCARSEIL